MTDAFKNEYGVGSFEYEMRGKPLAGGNFMVLWCLKGDLEHWSKSLGLRHIGSNEFCEFCPANSVDADPLCWNNFARHAAWKRQLFSVPQWRAIHTHAHWLFQCGYLTHHNLEPDELHCIYLGTAMHVAGNALFALCYRSLRGTPADNLRLVWGMILDAYRHRQEETQYSKLTLSMFCDVDSPHTSFPCLKGRGAEVKGLMLPLLDVWMALKDKIAEDYDLVWHLLEEQVAIQGILTEYKQELFLPRDVVKSFREPCG